MCLCLLFRQNHINSYAVLPLRLHIINSCTVCEGPPIFQKKSPRMHQHASRTNMQRYDTKTAKPLKECYLKKRTPKLNALKN